KLAQIEFRQCHDNSFFSGSSLTRGCDPPGPFHGPGKHRKGGRNLWLFGHRPHVRDGAAYRCFPKDRQATATPGKTKPAKGTVRRCHNLVYSNGSTRLCWRLAYRARSNYELITKIRTKAYWGIRVCGKGSPMAL